MPFHKPSQQKALIDPHQSKVSEVQCLLPTGAIYTEICCCLTDAEPKSRKGKGPGRHEPPSRSSLHDRRPLRTFPLAPPDFHIESHILVDSYLEKEVKYLGTVSQIPVDLDATNRTEVLRHIDRGKREEKIPCVVTREHDAIFSLSIHNIKISCRDGKEELYIRLPIHKIGAVCYIRDDDHHLLCIKFGDFSLPGSGEEQTPRSHNTDTCQLAVLNCDTRRSAEEMCSLISQTFQLVYTDATMQFFEAQLCEAARGMSLGTSTVRSEQSVPSTPQMRREHGQGGNLAFLSHSSLELREEADVSLPRRQNSMPRSDTRSDAESTTSHHDLLKEYVYTKLWNKLTNSELQMFANLVKKWQLSMPFSEFCESVLQLYGPNRKNLLLGMRPFVPEEDKMYFEAFLARVGLQEHTVIHPDIHNAPTLYSPATLRRDTNGASGTSQYGAVGGLPEFLDISHSRENVGRAGVDLDGLFTNLAGSRSSLGGPFPNLGGSSGNLAGSRSNLSNQRLDSGIFHHKPNT